MKLSEAIRLGATMKPQASFFFHYNGGTCAQGAALDAMGRLREQASDCHAAMKELWPWATDRNRPMSCPVGGGMSCEYVENSWLTEIVAHLNNEHKWTREQIADFVELHEPLPEPTVSEERESPCLQK